MAFTLLATSTVAPAGRRYCRAGCFWPVYGWFVVDLLGSIPSKKELRAFSDMASANILFDAADREVFTIAKEHRIEVPLAEISPNLIKAVIAIEDRRFFDHEGFDPIRIVGSAIAVVARRRSGPGRQHDHAATGAPERRPREDAAAASCASCCLPRSSSITSPRTRSSSCI